MIARRSTYCFSYVKDESSATQAAHRHPSVGAIAELVVSRQALLRDLSLLLLANVPIRPPGSQAISEVYRKQKGGRLTTEEEQLGLLLDQLYDTQDRDILDHRRGIVLERIVSRAIRTRVVIHGDELVDNLRSISETRSGARPINGYSVDVAACFPSIKRVEFHACKLHSGHMESGSLNQLNQLGDHFYGRRLCKAAQTALCCLETKDSVDDETWDLLDAYPNVDFYTVETLLDLARLPEDADDAGDSPTEASDGPPAE